ncbi:MAG: FliH/SctL family protein [bacterium]
MTNIYKQTRVKGSYKYKKDIKIQPQETKNIEEKNFSKEEQQLLTKAQKQAQAIIEKAKEQANEIISQAEIRAQEKEEKGYNNGLHKGFNDGITQGQKQGIEEMLQAQQSFLNLIESAKRELENNKQELSISLIKLATKLSNRIINAELSVNPSIINNIIIEMIQELINYNNIRVRVNPDLLDYINEEEIRMRFSKQNIEFIKDSSLQIGDCIIDSNFGGINGVLKEKLKKVEEQLIEGVKIDEGD